MIRWQEMEGALFPSEYATAGDYSLCVLRLAGMANWTVRARDGRLVADGYAEDAEAGRQAAEIAALKLIDLKPQH